MLLLPWTVNDRLSRRVWWLFQDEPTRIRRKGSVGKEIKHTETDFPTRPEINLIGSFFIKDLEVSLTEQFETCVGT